MKIRDLWFGWVGGWGGWVDGQSRTYFELPFESVSCRQALGWQCCTLMHIQFPLFSEMSDCSAPSPTKRVRTFTPPNSPSDECRMRVHGTLIVPGPCHGDEAVFPAKPLFKPEVNARVVYWIANDSWSGKYHSSLLCAASRCSSIGTPNWAGVVAVDRSSLQWWHTECTCDSGDLLCVDRIESIAVLLCIDNPKVTLPRNRDEYVSSLLSDSVVISGTEWSRIHISGVGEPQRKPFAREGPVCATCGVFCSNPISKMK